MTVHYHSSEALWSPHLHALMWQNTPGMYLSYHLLAEHLGCPSFRDGSVVMALSFGTCRGLLACKKLSRHLGQTTHNRHHGIRMDPRSQEICNGTQCVRSQARLQTIRNGLHSFQRWIRSHPWCCRGCGGGVRRCSTLALRARWSTVGITTR